MQQQVDINDINRKSEKIKKVFADKKEKIIKMIVEEEMQNVSTDNWNETVKKRNALIEQFEPTTSQEKFNNLFDKFYQPLMPCFGSTYRPGTKPELYREKIVKLFIKYMIDDALVNDMQMPKKEALVLHSTIKNTLINDLFFEMKDAFYQAQTEAEITQLIQQLKIDTGVFQKPLPPPGKPHAVQKSINSEEKESMEHVDPQSTAKSQHNGQIIPPVPKGPVPKRALPPVPTAVTVSNNHNAIFANKQNSPPQIGNVKSLIAKFENKQ